MKTYNILIDGGYLSYIMATNGHVTNQFFNERMYNEYTWLMDGNANFRKTDYPEYKGNRNYDLEIRDRVRAIRIEVTEHYKKSFTHPNLEGDDLCAIAHHLFPSMNFITFANDKDYLQIPRVNMWGYAKEGVKHYTVDGFRQKTNVAKAVKPYLNTRFDILFYQAMLGDTVDNIPRLLAPRSYDVYGELISNHRPFSSAYALYGEPFYTNLSLVLLPHPKSFIDMTPDKLMEALDDAFEYSFNAYFSDRSDINDAVLWVRKFKLRQDIETVVCKAVETSYVTVFDKKEEEKTSYDILLDYMNLEVHENLIDAIISNL